MNPIAKYKQHREIIRVIGWREWLLITLYIREIQRYLLVIWFCHHNARVISDFECRMVSVIYAATRGMMSKAYYHQEDMVSQIEIAFQTEYDEGYAEGVKDEKARQNAIRRGKGKKK